MRTSRGGQISQERVQCFVQAQTEYKNVIKIQYLVHNGNMEKVLESLTNMIGKQSDGEKSNSKKNQMKQF